MLGRPAGGRGGGAGGVGGRCGRVSGSTTRGGPARVWVGVPEGVGWGKTTRGGPVAGGKAPCWVLKEQPHPRWVGPPGWVACPGWVARVGCPGGWVVVSGARRGRLLWWLVVGWLWVEMCIVDASILLLLCVLCCGLCVVGKLVRADGGCLGTRGR